MSDSTKDTVKSTPSLVEKFVIRLPNGLREQIKALSEQNRRSMNSEIIMVLERHIKQYSQEDIKDFSTEQILHEVRTGQDNSDKDVPVTDQVLQERLEALPAEKKEALLELLG